MLERAKDTGELRLGYRADAQPFSFTNAEGRAAGYSVELCRAVGREVAAELSLPDLQDGGGAPHARPIASMRSRPARPTSCARPPR